MIVFIDTSAFLARHSDHDQHYCKATAIWREIEGTALVTTNHVVEETLTLLARRMGYGLAGEVADGIYSSSLLDIIFTTSEEERDALKLFHKFADQQVSFTDCISFAIMSRHRIRTAFTFDRHFTLAGFELLEPR